MNVYLKFFGFLVMVVGFVLAGITFTGAGPEKMVKVLQDMPMTPIMWVGVGVVGIVIIFFNRRPGD